MDLKGKGRSLIGLGFLLFFFGLFIGQLLVQYLGYHPFFPILSIIIVFSSMPLIILGSVVGELEKEQSSAFTNVRLFKATIVGMSSIGVALLIWSMILLFNQKIEGMGIMLYCAVLCFYTCFLFFYARKHYLKKQIGFRSHSESEKVLR